MWSSGSLNTVIDLQSHVCSVKKVKKAIIHVVSREKAGDLHVKLVISLEVN